MSAPQLPEGAAVAISISSKAGEIETTVTLGELLGSGGSASIYRIAAATPDPPIHTDGSMTPLTELVLRLEHPETGALAHRRDAIKFLEDRRPTDPELGALVPVYASGKGMSTQVVGYQGETALSVQVMKYAGVDLGKAMGDGLGWTRVCEGLAGVARTPVQTSRAGVGPPGHQPRQPVHRLPPHLDSRVPAGGPRHHHPDPPRE